MKNLSISALLTIALLTAVSLKMIGGFLQILDISENEANDYIWYSFQNGYFNYPYSDNYKSLNSAARITLVKEIGEFAKAYSRTGYFKK